MESMSGGFCAGVKMGVQNGKGAGDRGLLIVLAEAMFSVPKIRQAVLMITAMSRQQASSQIALAFQSAFMAMSKASHIDQLVCYPQGGWLSHRVFIRDRNNNFSE
jgi:hypothetical protein